MIASPYKTRKPSVTGASVLARNSHSKLSSLFAPARSGTGSSRHIRSPGEMHPARGYQEDKEQKPTDPADSGSIARSF